MKTIKIKNGIISGFGTLTIDPEATRKKCAPIIYSLPEAEKVRAKQQEKTGRMNEAGQAYNLAAGYLKVNKPNEAEQQNIKYRNFLAAAEIANDELKVLCDELNKKGADILRQNPVYDEPRAGEIVKTSVETEALEIKFAALEENQALTPEGEIVADYRGSVYYMDGVKIEITELGTAPDPQAKTYDELTEAEKIELLTTEQKQAEYTGKAEVVLAESVSMRQKLEIQGDPEALVKSQEFYNTEIDKLKVAYGL